MAIVLSFVLAPMASLADDVQDQLQRMEDRMAEMEDRLQATNDQLEAANDVVTRQQEVIDRSGIADQTAGSSGVAAFLDSLELGGWLAGSYFYNFNDPNGEGIAAGPTRGSADSSTRSTPTTTASRWISCGSRWSDRSPSRTVPASARTSATARRATS
jgi:uncharacterized coiled-coil protein SlyX